MKKVVLAAMLVATFGAHAAETGLMREVYACNFLAGKGMADLDAARDFLVAQTKKMGSKDVGKSTTFLWTPFKTSTDWDFLWFNMHENLNALGRDQDAYNNSPEGEAIGAKFGEIVECAAGIFAHEQIYDGGQDQDTDSRPVILESFACTLNAGKSMSDVRDAVAFWKKQVDALGIYKGAYDAYMQTPLIASAARDVYFFGVHPSMTEYAKRTTAYATSEGGMAADQRFDAVQSCSSSLWFGQVYISPED
jgi:hypothetical protein